MNPTKALSKALATLNQDKVEKVAKDTSGLAKILGTQANNLDIIDIGLSCEGSHNNKIRAAVGHEGEESVQLFWYTTPEMVQLALHAGIFKPHKLPADDNKYALTTNVISLLGDYTNYCRSLSQITADKKDENKADVETNENNQNDANTENDADIKAPALQEFGQYAQRHIVLTVQKLIAEFEVLERTFDPNKTNEEMANQLFDKFRLATTNIHAKLDDLINIEYGRHGLLGRIIDKDMSIPQNEKDYIKDNIYKRVKNRIDTLTKKDKEFLDKHVIDQNKYFTAFKSSLKQLFSLILDFNTPLVFSHCSLGDRAETHDHIYLTSEKIIDSFSAPSIKPITKMHQGNYTEKMKIGNGSNNQALDNGQVILPFSEGIETNSDTLYYILQLEQAVELNEYLSKNIGPAYREKIPTADKAQRVFNDIIQDKNGHNAIIEPLFYGWRINHCQTFLEKCIEPFKSMGKTLAKTTVNASQELCVSSIWGPIAYFSGRTDIRQGTGWEYLTGSQSYTATNTEAEKPLISQQSNQIDWLIQKTGLNNNRHSSGYMAARLLASLCKDVSFNAVEELKENFLRVIRGPIPRFKDLYAQYSQKPPKINQALIRKELFMAKIKFWGYMHQHLSKSGDSEQIYERFTEACNHLAITPYNLHAQHNRDILSSFGNGIRQFVNFFTEHMKKSPSLAANFAYVYAGAGSLVLLSSSSVPSALRPLKSVLDTIGAAMSGSTIGQAIAAGFTLAKLQAGIQDALSTGSRSFIASGARDFSNRPLDITTMALAGYALGKLVDTYEIFGPFHDYLKEEEGNVPFFAQLMFAGKGFALGYKLVASHKTLEAKEKLFKILNSEGLSYENKAKELYDILNSDDFSDELKKEIISLLKGKPTEEVNLGSNVQSDGEANEVDLPITFEEVTTLWNNLLSADDEYNNNLNEFYQRLASPEFQEEAKNAISKRYNVDKSEIPDLQVKRETIQKIFTIDNFSEVMESLNEPLNSKNFSFSEFKSHAENTIQQNSTSDQIIDPECPPEAAPANGADQSANPQEAETPEDNRERAISADDPEGVDQFVADIMENSGYIGYISKEAQNELLNFNNYYVKDNNPEAYKTIMEEVDKHPKDSIFKGTLRKLADVVSSSVGVLSVAGATRLSAIAALATMGGSGYATYMGAQYAAYYAGAQYQSMATIAAYFSGTWAGSAATTAATRAAQHMQDIPIPQTHIDRHTHNVDEITNAFNHGVTQILGALWDAGYFAGYYGLYRNFEYALTRGSYAVSNMARSIQQSDHADLGDVAFLDADFQTVYSQQDQNSPRLPDSQGNSRGLITGCPSSFMGGSNMDGSFDSNNPSIEMNGRRPI